MEEENNRLPIEEENNEPPSITFSRSIPAMGDETDNFLDNNSRICEKEVTNLPENTDGRKHSPVKLIFSNGHIIVDCSLLKDGYVGTKFTITETSRGN